VLRITRLSDYAIVVLGATARSGPSAFTARTAAARTGLPLPAVKKILKCLVREGVVESQRGTLGGYRLSRPATQIALADIIDAIEGPFALTDCGQSPTQGELLCEYLDRCGVHSNWSRINGIVRRALASVTLADMIGPGDRELVPLRVRGGAVESRRVDQSGKLPEILPTASAHSSAPSGLAQQ
jgi:FeS assembly SUF system regulator